MKKILVAFVALALAGASVQKAQAGGCGGGWGIAAAAVGGVAAGVVVGSALASQPVYYPAPGYGYTYYAPAPQPAVVYAAPARVIYAPVYRAPVYVAPPVVSVRFGFGGYHHGHW